MVAVNERKYRHETPADKHRYPERRAVAQVHVLTFAELLDDGEKPGHVKRGLREGATTHGNIIIVIVIVIVIGHAPAVLEHVVDNAHGGKHQPCEQELIL
jgi:hypothetical protein